MKKLIIWLLLLVTSFTADAQLIGGGPRKPKGGSTVDLSGYAVKTANNLFSGTNTFSGTVNYTSPWSTYQASYGSLNQGGSIAFLRGSDGLLGGRVGMSSATGTATEMVSNGQLQFISAGFTRFYTAGSEALRLFTNGNTLIGSDGTDDGNKLRVQGTANIVGVLTSQNIMPDGNSTRDLGSSGARYNVAWVNSVLSNGSAAWGSNIASGTLLIRQGNVGNSNVAGYHANTGNYFVQPAGAIPSDNGYRFQLSGSQRMTGDMVHSSTSNVYNYNTVAEEVNYERVKMGWAGNIFSISQEVAGTGVSREIRLGSNNGFLGLISGTSPNSYRYINGNAQAGFQVRSDLANSSGSSYALLVSPSVSQTLTAGYRAILVSIYENTVGSGTRLLQDWGLNTAANAGGTHTSVANINSAGDGFFAGGLTVGGNLIPSTDNNLTVGSAASRYSAGYFSAIAFGNAGRSFNISQLGVNTNVVFRVQPTTGNVVIQSPGAIPADRGYTLDVLGNQAVSGTFTLNDGVISKATGSSFSFDSGITASGGITTSTTTRATQGMIAGSTSAPDVSAMLEVRATTKGFLPPRMTELQKLAIASPATGLLIFQNDGTPGFQYWNGTAWKRLAEAP